MFARGAMPAAPSGEVEKVGDCHRAHIQYWADGKNCHVRGPGRANAAEAQVDLDLLRAGLRVRRGARPGRLRPNWPHDGDGSGTKPVVGVHDRSDVGLVSRQGHERPVDSKKGRGSLRTTARIMVMRGGVEEWLPILEDPFELRLLRMPPDAWRNVDEDALPVLRAARCAL